MLNVLRRINLTTMSALSLAVLATLALAAPSGARAAYQLGDTVADFTLLEPHGGPVSLSDFAGQVVLINFFATWCPPCNDEVPLLQEMFLTYRARGFTILGVDLLEPATTVAPWVQSFGLTYPVVLAPDWTLFQLFPVAGGLPYNAVVDQNGVLRYARYGIDLEALENLVRELLPEEPVPAAPASLDHLKALFR